MAESRAIFGVTCGGFELTLRETEAGGAQRKPADIQNVERHDVSAADFVQQVFFRHLAILEEDRNGGTAAQAHFLFFGPHGKSGKPALDDKRRKFLAVDFGKNGVYVGES